MSFLNPFGLVVAIVVLLLFGRKLLRRSDGVRELQNKALSIALFLALLAFARPVITHAPQQSAIEAHDYIIALDVSYSMLADDVGKSRFESAKKNIEALMQRLPKERFTIFIFTSNPLLIVPPTTDVAIATAALEALNPEYILTKSTSLSNLLDALGRFGDESKEVLLFSDGGEERDIRLLVQKAKSAGVRINVVAVGSKRGAVLKRNGQVLVDSNQKLVVSRINPLLKPLAEATGGFYVELNEDEDISGKIAKMLTKENEKLLYTPTQSHTELFIYPLLAAFAVLLGAYTKLVHRFIPLLLLLTGLFHAPLLQASLWEKDGFELYKEGHYLKAAEYFSKLPPSQRSYYNAACAYCKAGHYKKALELFSRIKTKNPKFKANIFYNMANCAVGLKRYDRAKELYKKALALNPQDKEAKENLLELYRHSFEEKKDVADMMPHVNDKQSTTTSKKNETKEDEKSDTTKKSASQRKQRSGSEALAGKGAEAKNKNSQKSLSSKKDTKEYRFGYGAYELINKGYINESHPW